MNNEKENKSLLADVELICVEAEVKHLLNHGIRICCPGCHAQDYEVYPTGQLSNKITMPEEDIHYVCRACGYIWNSEFLARRYDYRKSAHTGRYLPRYQKKEKK